jgi:integrase
MRALTDIAIRNLPATAKRREVPDPGQRGLYVVVQPSGTKSFAVRYRYAGKPRKLTLKSGIGLAAARKEAASALYEVEQGRDPITAKHQTKQDQKVAAANTFRAVADEYFRRDGGRLRTADQQRATLERLVYPEIGDRPIAEIRRTEIVRLLDKIEAGGSEGRRTAGGAVMADRTLAAIRKIMNWHATRSDDFRSPIVRGMARVKPKERARDRILTDDEIRAVWRTADKEEGPFARVLQFLLLTAARRSEAADLEHKEIKGNDWTLPAARNKTKLDLVRPLSDAALDVLARTPQLGGCRYVFSTDGENPISGFSRFKERFDKACSVTDWTPHDLRRTARSLMSRAGVASDHAERCLGHVIAGVRGTYDRHEYYEEKKRAYEVLAAQIDRIVNPQENVISIAEVRADR